jgi:tRNA threonylcarbamoyl adenosine modification protein YeaZ
VTARAGGPAAGAPVLVVDTATTRAVVALGTREGVLLDADAWDAGHRHAEELLARIADLLARAGVARPGPGSLSGVVVGTGPGGFTGLRVGLATARGIARVAAAPLVGIPTGVALAAAAGRNPSGAGKEIAVLLPAGPAGCYLVRDGRASLVATGDEPADPAPGAVLVAVDLAGRASAAAVARGEAARDGLAATLLALGAPRLRAGEDDGSRLGPEYVTMPRGVAAPAGEVAWSRGRP